MLHHRRETLPAADGLALHVNTWMPDGPPGAVIQVVHGLGEHSARYARFAAAAAGRGYAVVAHDQRGHGEHADEPGCFAAKGGWRKVVDDVHAVNAAIRTRHPDTPIVLLGHSMGAFVVQAFAMHHGGYLAGLILSACTWFPRLRLAPLIALTRVESWRLGGSGHSRLLDYFGFSGFNRRFQPARTGYDWLSRDPAEVDAYAADPLCGGPFTCSLWSDFAGGLWTVSQRESIGRVPGDLPILITGGADDPLGGDRGMGRLALHYAETLHNRLTVRIYPGGRHEMLNEINRDDAMADWLNWIGATTRSGR
jgi:alpha-beta hydrolase superfamily lysophospholipase